MAVIVLENLSRKYKDNTVLKNINLEVKSGENIVILGPNGSGKSTLLKLIAGILYPSSGSITVLGHKPYMKQREFLKNISFINPQKSRLIFDVSPMDNFLLYGSAYGLSFKRIKQRAYELSEMLEIEHKLNAPVRTLSFGERVKVEIISGLLLEPVLLLMDEPFIGIDFVTKNTLKNFLASIKSQIIITSHVFDILDGLIGNVIVLDKGNILYHGSWENLKKRVENKKVIVIYTVKEMYAPEGFIKRGSGEYSVIAQDKDVEGIYGKLQQDEKIEKIEIKNPEVEDILEELIE